MNKKLDLKGFFDILKTKIKVDVKLMYNYNTQVNKAKYGFKHHFQENKD
jgi:hypothetical protein